MSSTIKDFAQAGLSIFLCVILGLVAVNLLLPNEDAKKCAEAVAESAETTRMLACAKAGGSWVIGGQCIGPLPAPQEGK